MVAGTTLTCKENTISSQCYKATPIHVLLSFRTIVKMHLLFLGILSLAVWSRAIPVNVQTRGVNFSMLVLFAHFSHSLRCSSRRVDAIRVLGRVRCSVILSRQLCLQGRSQVDLLGKQLSPG